MLAGSNDIRLLVFYILDLLERSPWMCRLRMSLRHCDIVYVHVINQPMFGWTK